VGLFCTVLHCRYVERDRLLPALDSCLDGAGYGDPEIVKVPENGPSSPIWDEWEGPWYLVSPLHGRWITVIEGQFGLENVPWVTDVANQLSAALSCYALALHLHDDDVFYYNLEHNGESLDGYNSLPPYFEQEPLAATAVEEQRHYPEAFQPLLPPACSLQELEDLLNRGFWHAYKHGELDEDGLPIDEEGGLVDEEARMTAFGTMLQLHGTTGEYPYTAWNQSTDIQWDTFVGVRYSSL
jgi:hypothetical protein